MQLFAREEKPQNRFVEFREKNPITRTAIRANTWGSPAIRSRPRTVVVTGNNRGNRYKSSLLNRLDQFHAPLATAVAALILLGSPKAADSSKVTFMSTPEVRITASSSGDISFTRQHRDVRRVYKYLSKYSREKQPLKMAEKLVYGTDYGKTLAAIGDKETDMVAGLTGASGEKGKFQLMANWRPKGYNEFDDVQNSRIAEKVLKIKIKTRRGDWKKGIAGYNGGGPKARAYADDIVRRVRLMNRLA